jgi:hypothetical protein
MQDIEWTPTNKTTLNDNKNTKNLSSAYDTQQQQQQQKQYDSQRCSQITSATQSIRMITPPLEQQTQIIKQDEIDYDDDYQDDDDYFLSDDDDDDDDYFYYHKRKNNDIDFVNDFKKTQPRPTPRRSLLSDLIQKQCMISSNPTYCSSSNIKTFEQDLSQSLRDSIHRESLSDQEYSQKNAVHTKKRDLQPSWLESFHGW